MIDNKHRLNSAHCRQGASVKFTAYHGRQCEQFPALLIEQSQLLGYDRADSLRQNFDVRICREQLGELADEKRVAIRPRIDPVDEFHTGGSVAFSGDKLRDLVERAGVCETSTTVIHLRTVPTGTAGPEGWQSLTTTTEPDSVTYYLVTPR